MKPVRWDFWTKSQKNEVFQDCFLFGLIVVYPSPCPGLDLDTAVYIPRTYVVGCRFFCFSRASLVTPHTLRFYVHACVPSPLTPSPPAACFSTRRHTVSARLPYARCPTCYVPGGRSNKWPKKIGGQADIAMQTEG